MKNEKNTKTTAKIGIKHYKLAPCKKQQRYSIPIRNTLKNPIKSVQRQNRKDAA